MSMDKLQVGQKLWYVPSERRGSPHEVTVKSVGRKWATIDYNQRIDMQTMSADGSGYTSPGRCYLSKEQYEAAKALSNAWFSFRKEVYDTSRLPEGVTLNQIENARRSLFKQSTSSAKEGND